MAIYNGRILMRKGNEADFDAEKLMSGEWAVSLDKGIVRICLEAGKVIRMATYEAFEEDMKRVEAILLECQTVKEAVIRINTEVSTKANAVVELVEQAKTYRDEAEQFRNEAESFKNQAGEIVGIDIATNERAGIVKPDGETLEIDPDGTLRVIGGGGVSDYEEIENKPSINNVELSGNKTLEELGIASKEELDKTVFKVDTIIEKADLGIKETAIGEEIHLTDSADGKAVEYALYGKATQNTTSGKNMLPYPACHGASRTSFGISFVQNEDGSITVSGTHDGTTENSHYGVTPWWTDNVNKRFQVYASKSYRLSCKNLGDNFKFIISLKDTEVGSFKSIESTYVSGNNEIIYTPKQDGFIGCGLQQIQPVANEVITPFTCYPLFTLSEFDSTYEPYTGGIPSPNPDYPQEIEVAGSSGSVEVKSVGKNLWNPNGKSTNGSGVVRSGIVVPKGTYTITNNSNVSAYCRDGINNTTTLGTIVSQKSSTFTFNLEGVFWIANNSVVTDIQVEKGAVATEFEPYKETLSTIPTPNGIAGIKVDSGGNYTDTNGQQWICDEVVKYADGSGEKIERIKHYSLAVADMNSSDRYPGWVNISDLDQVVGTINGTIEKSMCNIGEGFRINTENGQKTIYLPTSVFILNQTEWKTNYPNLVIDFYIARISPIRTPLTAQQLADIETFYPVTNISNDFDCEMKVKYKADGKNYIDKRLALIEQALINNI